MFSAACCVVLRWPCSVWVELPLEEGLPDPPLAISGIAVPQLDESDCVLNELVPFTDSLKAELNVAFVEVSASASCCCASSSVKNSLSVTIDVSVRSKIATCCCSPGARGSEYTKSPKPTPWNVQRCASHNTYPSPSVPA